MGHYAPPDPSSNIDQDLTDDPLIPNLTLFSDVLETFNQSASGLEIGASLLFLRANSINLKLNEKKRISRLI